MHFVDQLKSTIRDVKDFPKPGVLFKDITPLFSDAGLMKETVAHFVKKFQGPKVDAVIGIEARGFILGSLLAYVLECPFIPVRKAGKLPYTTVKKEYALEYGTSAIEMHVDAVKAGWRVLIHDDVLATGGTAMAAGELVQSAGGQLAGFCFILNLGFLGGAKKIQEKFGVDPFYIVEY